MKIINLIEYIEQRPLMYLREKSLIQLDAFLGGYQAVSYTHLDVYKRQTKFPLDVYL